jgi:LysM repeat protein
MAIDLRYSGDRNCRRWLEGVLISLEDSGVLEATRERYPAHYHIALFPRPYASYVQRRASAETPSSTRSAQRVAEAASTIETYQVRRGDSLWTIAREHGVSVADIRSSNDLRSSRIFAGQMLRVPVRSRR